MIILICISLLKSVFKTGFSIKNISLNLCVSKWLLRFLTVLLAQRLNCTRGRDFISVCINLSIKQRYAAIHRSEIKTNLFDGLNNKHPQIQKLLFVPKNRF